MATKKKTYKELEAEIYELEEQMDWYKDRHTRQLKSLTDSEIDKANLKKKRNDGDRQMEIYRVLLNFERTKFHDLLTQFIMCDSKSVQDYMNDGELR